MITIGLVDSGVDSTHELLGKRIVGGINFSGNGEGEKDYGDIWGHGTFSAGMICQTLNNWFPDFKCQIYVLKVLDKRGARASVESLIKAIAYAAANGIRVLSISLGFTSSPKVSALKQIIDLANKVGVVLLASPGEENLYYPAEFDNVISVSATDNEGHPLRYKGKVNIGFDGINVTSSMLNNTYYQASGHSFAVPNLAPVVARIVCDTPNIKFRDIEKKLLLHSKKCDQTLIRYFSLKNYINENQR